MHGRATFFRLGGSACMCTRNDVHTHVHMLGTTCLLHFSGAQARLAPRIVTLFRSYTIPYTHAASQSTYNGRTSHMWLGGRLITA
jgi:hypothetical protein